MFYLILFTEVQVTNAQMTIKYMVETHKYN